MTMDLVTVGLLSTLYGVSLNNRSAAGHLGWALSSIALAMMTYEIVADTDWMSSAELRVLTIVVFFTLLASRIVYLGVVEKKEGE